MDVKINSFQNRVIPIGEYAKPKQTGNLQQDKVNNGSSFKDIFAEKLQGELKFSKHAEQRLAERNISLDDSDKKKLNTAVAKAGEKGVKDSLVLMDNLALVVNVKSKTVITVMSNSELKENIFTNIDGAVFA